MSADPKPLTAKGGPMLETTYRTDSAGATDALPDDGPGEATSAATATLNAVSTSDLTMPQQARGPEIAPPTESPKPRLVVAFALAQFALFVALLGPVMVSMAIKVTAVVGPDHATSAVGVILGVGAIAALVGNPIFGR